MNITVSCILTVISILIESLHTNSETIIVVHQDVGLEMMMIQTEGHPFLLHVCELRYSFIYQFSSVQFSPLTDWIVGGTRGTIQWRSSSSFFFFFCWRPL